MNNHVISYYDTGNIKSEIWYDKSIIDPSIIKFHRKDGPARIYYYFDGVTIMFEEWYINSKLHCINGPARILYHISGEISEAGWWIDGTKYTLSRWLVESNLSLEKQVELKIIYG